MHICCAQFFVCCVSERVLCCVLVFCGSCFVFWVLGSEFRDVFLLCFCGVDRVHLTTTWCLVCAWCVLCVPVCVLCMCVCLCVFACVGICCLFHVYVACA
jgi:hypothetical protein